MSTANFSVIGDSYKIVLDASFDLHAAGYPNNEIHCRAFAEGFRRSAQEAAIALGHIDITVISGSYEGPQMLEQTSNGDEGELWQQIHNRTKPAQITIEIYADGVWCGQGRLTRDNEIVCDASLGDDVYEAIQDAIGDDETSVECDGVTYGWVLSIA